MSHHPRSVDITAIERQPHRTIAVTEPMRFIPVSCLACRMCGRKAVDRRQHCRYRFCPTIGA